MLKNIIIDDIEVDLTSLYSIAHQCRPGSCTRHQCCCSQYDICIDNRELTTIIGYLPEASKLAPFLSDGSDFENIFEEEEPDLFRIDAEEEGLCLFAYSNEKEHILCSLHSVALSLNEPPHKVKPRSCITWPLAISDQTPLLLSIADDAFNFPCNTRRRNRSTSLDPNIAQIVRDIFGEQFLMRVKGAGKIVSQRRSAEVP